MGNKLSQEDADTAKEMYHLLVNGFAREHTSKKSDVGPDVIVIICAYGRIEHNQISMFSPKYYDKKKWKISDKKRLLKGIHPTEGIIGGLVSMYSNTQREGSYWCVGFKDREGNFAFDKGVHCLSVKYVKGSAQNVRGSIGVVLSESCRKQIGVNNPVHRWPYLEHLAFSGIKAPMWSLASIITIKLDLDERKVMFYKQMDEMAIINKIGEECLSSTGAYCFLLCANPDELYYPQFQIITNSLYSIL